MRGEVPAKNRHSQGAQRSPQTLRQRCTQGIGPGSRPDVRAEARTHMKEATSRSSCGDALQGIHVPKGHLLGMHIEQNENLLKDKNMAATKEMESVIKALKLNNYNPVI